MLAVSRPIKSITTSTHGFEGEGFPVRRAFAGVDLATLDPFLHLDQMGEVDYAPGEPKGTPWHPHRGFETVTYMIDGEMQHHDSQGGGGLIGGGDTQWMTAGAGILHIETPPEHLVASGGLFHGFQLWVNLPRSMKFADPRYQDIGSAQVALVTSADGGGLLRIIAGDLGGPPRTRVRPTPRSPWCTPRSTRAPSCGCPGRPSTTRWCSTWAARATVGDARQPLLEGQLAVFGAGDSLTIGAEIGQDARHAGGVELLLLGGRPINEPVAMYGPFVMNTRRELQEAFADYQAGRLGVIPAEYLPHT